MIKQYDTPFPMAEITGTKKEMREKCGKWLDLWLSLQLKRGIKGCIIFDIDDTVIEEKDEKLIDPIANIFKKYRDLGVPVIFVTARPNVRGNKKETENMLKKRGLDGYSGLDLIPERSDDVDAFKFERRNYYYKKYGNVLARIGDQYWDSITPPHTLKGDTELLKNMSSKRCFILFHPKLSEVSVKLPG